MILIFFINILLSYFLLKITLPFFGKFFLDIPNKRSLHKKTVFRAGGIIFVILSVIFSTFRGYYLPIFCLPLAIIGLIDDKINLSSSIKYLFQLATVICLIFNIFPSIYLNLFTLTFLIFFGTAMINFINFMDGSDGLVAGCLSVVLLFFSFKLNQELSPLAGALIGFLILNWSPAKVFMGDVGSTFLGAILFGIFLQTKSYEGALTVLLITFPLIGDAFTCVLRRYFMGQNIFKAHKLHLYQRLCESGWSHQNVAIIYLSFTFVLILSNLLGGFSSLVIVSGIIFLIGIWLDQTKAIKFKEASNLI